MSPSNRSFTALNCHSDTVLPDCMDYFTLHARPNTDLWRKPPSRDTCTSPILYTRLTHPFVAAEVTVSAEFEMEWDQGGLVIFAGSPPTPSPPPIPNSQTHIQAHTPNPTPTPTSIPTSQPSEPPPPYTHPPSPPTPTPAAKWVKAGLEFCNGEPHASSVSATSDGADWATSPIPIPIPTPYPHSHTRASPSPTCPSNYTYQPYPQHSPHGPNYTSLRIKLERIGYALWIWFAPVSVSAPDSHDLLHPRSSSTTRRLDQQGWKKLREVTSFFYGVDEKCVRVGVYASRPADFGVSHYARTHGVGVGGGRGRGRGRGAGGEGERELEVEFEGLEIF
ncbi:hypothetical protein MMC16_001657 [Acarospora aff. strigata]|nr:hypothetical protein [Acarospora aff. strigata]